MRKQVTPKLEVDRAARGSRGSFWGSQERTEELRGGRGSDPNREPEEKLMEPPGEAHALRPLQTPAQVPQA